jgi:hypothetical protein
MVSTFDAFLIQSPETAGAAVWMGLLASSHVCALVRLPILAIYVASAGTSKRYALLLAILLAVGVAAGMVFLGQMATPTGDGVHRTLQVSQPLFWALGACLIAAGVLFSGLINPRLMPQKLRCLGERLVRMEVPGALLLGFVLGLLLTPVCSACRAGLLTVMEGTPLNHPTPLGPILLVGFAAGQGLAALGIGVLTALFKPSLIAWLRTRMCSIEPRMRLLTGNVLIVLGIYFVVVG